MTIHFYLNDVLNAQPIGSTRLGAQPPDDFVVKLFDGAARSLQIAGGEECDLAVRPHRLNGVQVGLVEHRYFHDIVWTQQEGSGPGRQAQPGRSWGELSRGRSRMRALIVEPGLERPLVDHVFAR